MRLLSQSFLRSWQHHASIQMATLVVLTGTFTIITLFFFLHSNLTRLLTRWGDEVQMAVFLEDNASSEQISRVQKFLTHSGVFSKVHFVSKQEAALKFQKQMGHQSPLLINDPDFANPLPASFEVLLQQGVSTDQGYKKMVDLAQKIGELAGVEDISYGQGWVENYASLVKVFSSSSWLLIIVLLAGSLLVVGNAVRSSVQQRRDEIEVMELVGATPFMIRAPFIFEGAMLGLAAAIFSSGICFLLYRWQQQVALEHLGFWGMAAEVRFLTWDQVLSVLLLGGWFGAFGSYLCVRGIATGWSAANKG